jgi:hypothetical protein
VFSGYLESRAFDKVFTNPVILSDSMLLKDSATRNCNYLLLFISLLLLIIIIHLENIQVYLTVNSFGPVFLPIKIQFCILFKLQYTLFKTGISRFSSILLQC